MTLPKYKIEVWEPGGGSPLHTITTDALVYFKEVVTDGIGHFNFTVPTKKIDYVYNDIDLNDTVKIWLGYDSISGNPLFIGKVGNISGPLSIQSGYIRQISGLSQGEILRRRFKKNKYYDGIGASTIVTEWANDLNLGVDATKLVPDATAVTLEVKTKNYFDLLRFISDYWYDATTQLKKDFYVDIDNDLVWKDRPFRTSGVETLTVGGNILHYNVTRKIDQIKNDIVVYGAAEKPKPSDKDSWTESLSNWTASAGSLSLGTANPKVGSYDINCYSGAGASITTFKRDIPRITIRDITTLYFWHSPASLCDVAKVRLHAPDSSNYFEADLSTSSGWTFNEFALGPNNEYEADTNPNGKWTPNGSPNWWNIEYIQFHLTYSQNGVNSAVDGLYFHPERWEGTASDTGAGSSQEKYGRRDLEVTDDKLHSDSDCTKRAETLLYQLKDPPVQIEVTTLGNTNILVGDRLSMTIPAEGISSQNYDVISVEQSFSNNGFITKATMVNSANIRQPIQTDPIRRLIELDRTVRNLAINEQLYP